MGHVRELGFPSLPDNADELAALHLNGRATESQFAQNPLPVARAMGRALAVLHTSPVPETLAARTDAEAKAALEIVNQGGAFPEPFSRVRAETLTALLENRPADIASVHTHGAPIVGSAVLVDSVVIFDDHGTAGYDPAERDLSIAFRSVAETFTSEVTATLLDGYLEAGGSLPHGPTLDWYGVVAAFR